VGELALDEGCGGRHSDGSVGGAFAACHIARS
jgi:hypothetical protein